MGFDKAIGPSDRFVFRFARALLLVLTALASWSSTLAASAVAAAGTAVSSDALFTYDGPAIECVETPSFEAFSLLDPSAASEREESASPSVQVRSASSTLLRSRNATESVPSVIYREGTPRPGNLTPRAVDDGMLSFRDSLSNPWVPPAERPPGWRPVLRPDEPYIGIDTSQLRERLTDPG